MSDVILSFPVGSVDEDRLFGRFVDDFIVSFASELSKAVLDAPFLMVRDEPTLDQTRKVVIFQEVDAAKAFSQGWNAVRGSWYKGAA
jgi:hypothetical protein